MFSLKLVICLLLVSLILFADVSYSLAESTAFTKIGHDYRPENRVADCKPPKPCK